MWFIGILLFLWHAAHAQVISLTSQSIDVNIENRYAFITYSFYFVNTDAPDSDESSELSYQIQLEPNTFISYFYAELNGVKFRGETKEKVAAQTEYNHAVEAGLDAVLISQNHDANVFNVRTNIAAGGVAVLNITAEQFMLRRFGYYELALTVTNAYGSTINPIFASTPITTTIKDDNGVSYTDVIVPTNANYNAAPQSTSQYDIDITVDRLSTDTNVAKTQQLLMRYKTTTMQTHNQFTFDAQSLTFLHILSYEGEAILPRRVVFVLDRSGSMGTTKWAKAVAATKGAIDNLKPGIDRMNIILFDDTMNTYESSMVPVTASVITASKTWIDSYSSGGSTDIHQAVVDALKFIQNDIDPGKPYVYVNQVILITDGQPTSGVTDPTQIQTGIMNANAQLKPAQAAVFCLGIGDDYGTSWVTSLNYPMLRGIATQNDGFDARIKQSETETILNEYYGILESPVLAYISLEYTNIDAATLTRHRFRCLYSGTDVVIAAKFPDDSTVDMDVSLYAYTSGEAVVETRNLDIDWSNSGNNDDGYVAERIWAYLKLISYRRTLDNPLLAALLQTQGKTEAVALALEHELVTPWTSMIAVAYRGNEKVNVTDHKQDATDPNVNMEMDDMDSGVLQNYGGSPNTPPVGNPNYKGSVDNMGDVDDNAREQGDDDDEDDDSYYIPPGNEEESVTSTSTPIYVVVIVIVGVGLVVAAFSCWLQRSKSKSADVSFSHAEKEEQEEEEEETEGQNPNQVQMVTTPNETGSTLLLEENT